MSPSNSSPELIELKSFKIMPHMLATSSINHNGIASGTGVGVAWDAALELAMEASISEDDLENEEVHQAFRRIKNFFACPEPRLIIESRTGTIMKGIVVGILAKWREDGDNEDDEEVIMRMRDVEKLNSDNNTNTILPLRDSDNLNLDFSASPDAVQEISFDTVESIKPLHGGFELFHFDGNAKRPFWIFIVGRDTAALSAVGHRLLCPICSEDSVMRNPGVPVFGDFEDYVMRLRWEDEQAED